MHDGMPYDRNQGQGQGHSREVDRQSPTGLIFKIKFPTKCIFQIFHILTINGMAPFCNLFIERPLYIVIFTLSLNIPYICKAHIICSTVLPIITMVIRRNVL